MSKRMRSSWFLALCLVSGGGAYAFAQAKPAAPHPAAMSCEHGCPMHAVKELANVQVENNAQGVVIKLVSKKPEDVAKLQELASKLVGESGCPMMHEGHEGHHGMMMHPAPAAAAPAAPVAPAPKK